MSSKILDLTEALKKSRRWKFFGDTLVFTNGCFDVVHPGHVHLLKQAASFGTHLIVGLNSDDSTKRLKGESRPYFNEEQRAEHLAAFEFVDIVVLFDEPTPGALIEAIKPNVVVKGGDYSAEEIVGASVVKADGGQVVLVPFLEGFSTSSILNQS